MIAIQVVYITAKIDILFAYYWGDINYVAEIDAVMKAKKIVLDKIKKEKKDDNEETKRLSG